MNRAEIEKGCGKELVYSNCGTITYNLKKKKDVITLCPTCQVRLSQRIDDEKEVKEKIEDWFIMLNTPEFDGNDAGLVRDEMKEFLSSLDNGGEE